MFMMKRAVQGMIVMAGMMVMAAPAGAQMLEWQDRGFVNVNFAIQSRSAADVKASTTFTQYDEQAKIDITQKI
jgi:hypothetical protein